MQYGLMSRVLVSFMEARTAQDDQLRVILQLARLPSSCICLPRMLLFRSTFIRQLSCHDLGERLRVES